MEKVHFSLQQLVGSCILRLMRDTFTEDRSDSHKLCWYFFFCIISYISIVQNASSLTSDLLLDLKDFRETRGHATFWSAILALEKFGNEYVRKRTGNFSTRRIVGDDIGTTSIMCRICNNTLLQC